MLRPDARLHRELLVAPRIGKNGSERRVLLHPDLRLALARLHLAQGKPLAGAVVRSERGSHLTAHSVVNSFRTLYARHALDGCSSHSGRRTFISRSAKLLAHTGGSLRDVQEQAGHRSLATTERYIAGHRDAQPKLVRLI